MRHLHLLMFIAFLFVSCQQQSDIDFKDQNSTDQIRPYTPIDKTIFNEITAMDEVFFNAYNTCDLEKQSFIYSEDIEFFHDKGGLMTSKEELLAGTKNNICGKVTRTLIEGSIEVYPINGYGAVEIGHHKFYNNQEPDAKSHASKFIIVWKKETTEWKITKVISLH